VPLTTELTAARKRKLEALGCDVTVGNGASARELAWLQKSEVTVGDELWRPPAVHRKSARGWLVRTDSQIRHGTCYNGWRHFIYDSGKEAWTNPWRFLGVTLSLDLGGDGLRASNALLYHYDASVWVFPDFNHMAARSYEASLKCVGLWELMLLLQITMNLEFGPYLDETRRGQLAAATSWTYTNRTPSQCPLLRHVALGILEDVRANGLFDVGAADDVESALWGYLSMRSRNPPTGRRCTTCRFGAPHAALRRLLPFWRTQCFERTLVALDTDVLHGVRFREKLTARLAGVPLPGQESTTTRGLRLEDRVLPPPLRQRCWR